MKVGFISIHDPDDPDSLSGMPFSMTRALKERGCGVVSFVPAENRRRWHHAARSTVACIITLS